MRAVTDSGLSAAERADVGTAGLRDRLKGVARG